MSDLISRQAAIDAINQYIGQFDAIDVNFLDGLKTARNIICEIPTQTNTPNTLKSLDCIDRQAAIDALGERPLVWDEWADEYDLGQRNQYDSDKLAIETVPSAEPEISRIEQELHGKTPEEQSVKHK